MPRQFAERPVTIAGEVLGKKAEVQLSRLRLLLQTIKNDITQRRATDCGSDGLKMGRCKAQQQVHRPKYPTGISAFQDSPEGLDQRDSAGSHRVCRNGKQALD